MTAIFIIVIGTFIFVIFKKISQWNHNKQPQIMILADVKTKCSQVRGGANDTAAHTDNYVTFEVKSGDRMEFEVKPQEYRQLVEGNKGRLSFQSTRYLWFERKRHTESI
jgi:hypothetical protein